MAKTHDPSIPPSLSIFIVTSIPGFLSLAGATKHGGFSVELIHRDPAKSPLYTESTYLQKLHNSFLRSIKRAKQHFYPHSKTKPEADIPESQYDQQYADNSVSIGNLVSDTLTLDSTSGRKVALPNVVVGCGYINGPFSEQTSGMVALGGGSVSLVSQISSSIDGEFSYWLAPLSSNATTKLNFGANGVISGSGAWNGSTPMVPKDPKIQRLSII